MPLPPTVEAALRFWDSTGTPPTIWATTGQPSDALPLNVSLPDKGTITSALSALYSGSGTFRTTIDNHLTASGLIRIGSSTAIDVGASYSGGSIDDYVIFDLSDISALYYFNEGGYLVQEIAELTIAHELIHNILGLADPIAASELTMNGTAFDFKGDTVRMQNTIAAELGYWNNVQASYDALIMSTDTTLFSEFSTSFSYSNNRQVDIARYGLIGADTLDHSNRSDSSFDLLFGRAGDDILRGGEGDDSLWGGADNDTLEGGDHDDLLSGDEGADTIDGGNGVDTVSYELATQAVSMELFGSNPHGGAAAGDTISNVENIIGSAYADTISLAGATADGRIEGRGGADTLMGSAFTDFLLGEGGGDILSGGDSADHLYGGDDDDMLNGGDGDDYLYAENGEDTLNGGAGMDTLYGGDGNDTLDGGDGADELWGGDGDDILILNHDYWPHGGDGADTYHFTNTTAVTLDWTMEYWIDSDAPDSILYDGNAIGGNAQQLAQPIGLGAAWIDETGTSYAGGEGALWVLLPTNEAIYISGWSNGDMGITLPGI